MERSSFFNSVITNGKPDRVYLAEDFARYFASFIGNGVFPNPATNLQVVAVDGMDIAVMKGKAWINGYFYENTDNLNIKLDPADGLLNRIDRVVVRVNLNTEARNARIHLKKGKYANKPVAPSLQRDADVYEIALADIKVNKGAISIKQGDITDTRLSKELCGIVHGVVDQVDTETLFKQYESWYKETTGKADADLKVIIENFEKDTEKYLSEYQEWFNSFTDEKDTEFNEWFNTVKNILDENIASKLYKEIEELREYVDEQVEQAGKVDSVNGKTGDVELTARDIPYNSDFSVEAELKIKAYKRDLDDKADESYVDKEIDKLSDEKLDKRYIRLDQYPFDSVKETGFYQIRDEKTSPSGTSHNYLMYVGASNSANSPIFQHAINTWNGDAYTRSHNTQGWTEWRKLSGDGVRTSTIVIANYDSSKQSIDGADIVINKGENAAKKINDSIQSLKGTGGEVKLMEGNYNLEYGIAINVDGVHLTGIPKATILVQNKAWKGNPFNNDRKHVIDTWRDGDLKNVNVEISNIHVKGANISGSYGFNCHGSSKITNCISENSGSYGFWGHGSSKITNCISENSGSYGFWGRGSSKITNCISEDSGSYGFYCYDSSKITNCISENSGSYGFYCYDSSKITNCISENSGEGGFYCAFSFKGICGHNTLIGDKLDDNSSSPAIVQYNIIQEGV